MRRFLPTLVTGILTLGIMVIPNTARATDGYFSVGYGMKASGMGGAATATAKDTSGGANNPASMVWVKNRIDLGVTLFMPRRSASRSGLGPGLDGTSTSASNLFAIPEFGYNHMVNPKLAIGVSVYGNGGLNTNYPSGAFNCGHGPANMLCGNGTLGVNLIQLIVAPTISMKLDDKQSIGIAPLFGYQQFAAQGLQAFANTPNLSAAPSLVTNTGPQGSTGFGVRVGYMRKLSSALTFGAAYATRMHMSRFTQYSGLFAGAGSFDIPENFSLGIALLAMPKVTLAMDYQRINYSAVASVGDPSTNQSQLGAANGPGFGWRDVNVLKLGAAYAASSQLTLRAGYNHGSNPIQSRDVTFNIIAPGVTTDHLTLGGTYTQKNGGQLTVAFVRAFKNSVSGASLLPAFMGGAPAGNETIQLRADSVGIAYGRTF